MPAYHGDVEVLGRSGLLIVAEPQAGVLTFDVTPYGFQVYADLKSRAGESIVRIEREIRSLLDSQGFQATVLVMFELDKALA
jgi:hypothetical protein